MNNVKREIKYVKAATLANLRGQLVQVRGPGFTLCAEVPHKHVGNSLSVGKPSDALKPCCPEKNT